MEGVKALLKCQDVKISLCLTYDTVEIRFQHQVFSSTFKFTKSSELFDILNFIKENEVSLEYLTISGGQVMYLYWCLKNLTSKKVNSDYFTSGDVGVILEQQIKHERWHIILKKYNYSHSPREPMLCVNLSGYDILLGIDRGDNFIYFDFLLPNGSKERYQCKFRSGVTEIDVWLFNKTSLYIQYTIGKDKLSKHRFGIHDFDCAKMDLLIVDGLSGQCGQWSDFLLKGLYDPRLFFWIAAFSDEKLLR